MSEADAEKQRGLLQKENAITGPQNCVTTSPGTKLPVKEKYFQDLSLAQLPGISVHLTTNISVLAGAKNLGTCGCTTRRTWKGVLPTEVK